MILLNSPFGEITHQPWFQISKTPSSVERKPPISQTTNGSIPTSIQKFKKEVLKLLKPENYHPPPQPLMPPLNTLEIGLQDQTDGPQWVSHQKETHTESQKVQFTHSQQSAEMENTKWSPDFQTTNTTPTKSNSQLKN